MKVKCTECNSVFNQKPSLSKGNNFCSRKCYHKFSKGKKRNYPTLVGKKFNMLLVKEAGQGKMYKGNKVVRTWIVECDCGNTKEVSTQNLKITKSCGCIKLMPENNWLFNPDRVEAVCKEQFRSYIKGAKRRSLEFKLTFKQFKKLILSKCYYCGEGESNKTRHSYDKEKVHIIGVDRLNNDVGYTKENSVPCCGICNYMKRKFSEEVFINQAIKISKNYDRNK